MGSYKNYNPEVLDKSLQAIQERMNVHGASKQYQVPLTTLSYEVDGRKLH